MRLSRFAVYNCAALAIIGLMGILCLPIPFMGDQVIHVLGAMKMDAGGVLYRDFWDLKQPGIFLESRPKC